MDNSTVLLTRGIMDNSTVLLMFISRCILSNGKEGQIFYQITEEQLASGELENEPDEIVLKSNKATRGSSGIVYDVKQPQNNSTMYYPDSARYAGTWPDRIKCAEWQLLDQAQAQEISLRKQAKKAKTDDAVLKCLEPVREAYHQARGIQRNLILARAVQYITRKG